MLEVVIRQGRRCIDCDIVTKLTRGHLVPLSRGGSNDISNIAGQCKCCNSRQGARIHPLALIQEEGTIIGWDSVGKGEGGGSSLPILKVEAGQKIRLRFVGSNSTPSIGDVAQYKDGPAQMWSHWAPDELAEKVGHAVTLPCSGQRSGCIFHEEPLRWRNAKSNYVNVIVYEDVDGKNKTFGARKVLVFQGGVQIMQQIREQSQSVGIEPDEKDWIVSKTGKGRDTAWTAVMIDPLEATIDLSELDEQSAFADGEFPCLVDYTQFDAFKTMTPAEQRAFYEKLLVEPEGESEGESEGASAEPPAAPAGALSAKPAAAKPGGKIALPKPGQKAAPAAAAAPVVKPSGLNPKPAPAPAKVPNPAFAAYTAATQVLIPWDEEQTLGGSTSDVDLIIETGVSEEYQISQELLDAATLVKAGEPAQFTSVTPPAKTAPAGAKKPGSPVPQTSVQESVPDSGDVEGLQAQLLQRTKSSVFLKNFKNLSAFLKNLADGAKAVSKITDAGLLQSLIDLCDEGDEAIEAAVTA